jgi:adenylate cyclase
MRGGLRVDASGSTLQRDDLARDRYPTRQVLCFREIRGAWGRSVDASHLPPRGNSASLVPDRAEQDDFARKFRLALEALNWSRTRCARELGLDKSVVSRWASGGQTPTEHNLTRFTAMVQQAHPRFQAGDWRLNVTAFAALFRTEAPVREAMPVPGGRPSIAVLAFDNMSGDPEGDFFADGIAEDIITELSRSRSFLVISRGSSFTYRGRAVDVKQIASALDVRYVLEGSVRHERDLIRVTAQLIEAESGTHIWAERYDRDRRSVFAIQDEITRTVATAIGSAVADAEMSRAMNQPSERLGAWELYQRGMWHLATLDAAGNEAASGLFERAVGLDPIFAAAHVGLTYCYIWAGGLYMSMPVAEAYRLASIHARKAVELDPGDADALAVLAWIQMYQGALDNVVELARRALSVNPNCARAYVILGLGLIFSGHTAEGREAISVFERLSPRDPTIMIARRQIVVSHYFDRDYERCVDAARRLLSADPALPLNYRWMAAALGQLGRTEEARAALEKSITVSPGEYDVYVRNRIPWMRPEDYEHMLDGMRKAGWDG